MNKQKVLLICLMLFSAGCAGAGSNYLKYKDSLAQIDARAARGEITPLDAANLKLQAEQNYAEARKREEKQFDNDSDRLIKDQNQDLNAAARRYS